MLAALLRRVARQPTLTASPQVARLSTSQPLRKESVSQVLLEEADKKEKKASTSKPNYSTAGDFTGQSVNQSTSAWKPFEAGRFIRPHQLTYKYRLQPTRRLIRPPTVGPGSAESRYGDVFHQLGIDPLDQCMNPQLLSHFVSDMGKIYGRHITKLTTRSQRRLGKAIRRAKMMGVIPILSKAKKSSWIYRR